MLIIIFHYKSKINLDFHYVDTYSTTEDAQISEFFNNAIEKQKELLQQ